MRSALKAQNGPAQQFDQYAVLLLAVLPRALTRTITGSNCSRRPQPLSGYLVGAALQAARVEMATQSPQAGTPS
jgi:hypothetical protein